MFTLLQQFVEKKIDFRSLISWYTRLNHTQYNIIHYIVSQISNCNNNDGIRICKYARINDVGTHNIMRNIAQR